MTKTGQRQEEEIPFVFRKHRVEMVLPELHGHAMVVFEERVRP
jgi:hypothetical protein